MEKSMTMSETTKWQVGQGVIIALNEKLGFVQEVLAAQEPAMYRVRYCDTTGRIHECLCREVELRTATGEDLMRHAAPGVRFCKGDLNG